MRLRSQLVAALAATVALLPTAVHAVFKDEVGDIDYHHELVGVPRRATTFFHRPRAEDKASLLYTLSDVGVLGAVNPATGAVLWRQQLRNGNNGSITITGDGPAAGHLRAGEGAGWLCSAAGSTVQGWDAVSGRNTFSATFAGQVRDLEIMELTETTGSRKDVLVLLEEEDATVLRRLNGRDGSVVWEFRETTRNVPLQVSTSVQKVFVVSLHGTPGSYGLRVAVLDTPTGRRLDEINVGTKGDIHHERDVIYVGANSAAPIVAWTDEAKTKLRVHVLGTKLKQEFALAEGTREVEVHAPHLVQSDPHFLVHSRTAEGNRADVYHIDLKTNAITKAYELPLLPGKGAFATSSIGSNVYFTRIGDNEMTLTSSTSNTALARWASEDDIKTAFLPLHAVSEVVKRSADAFAIRAAVVTDEDDWVLLRNGQTAWTRPEGLSAAVTAAYAEIPVNEEFARTLEQEAHGNPLAAYLHRVKRHIDELQHLPAYLSSLPRRVGASILGTDIVSEAASPLRLSRDTFGLNKLVILATARGKLYCLDLGNHGRILWSKRAFTMPEGEAWDVKGMMVDDSKGHVTVESALGELIIVRVDSGETVKTIPRGQRPAVQSTAVVDGPAGQWLLSIGKDGKVGDLPASLAPSQIVVVRGAEDELHGLSFITGSDDTAAHAETMWTFSPPTGQHIVSIATRPAHDPVASIGRVLGDRRVKYKYLNPNTIVVATASHVTSPAVPATLTIYLLDTVSGQILSSATHEGVDSSKPVSCAIAENWFLCSFYGQYSLRDLLRQQAAPQSLRGYQVVVSDLYESDLANDRGPLGAAANFSALSPIDTPLDSARAGPALPLPAVTSQAFVLAAPVAALAITQTRQGIGSRSLLAYLPHTHAIVALPRMLLEPRRPVGRDPSAQEAEEGLMKYTPIIEIDPKHVVTHERDVLGVVGIVTAPAVLESTVLVTAYGVDVFGTRVTPSLAFDILGKGFNKPTLILTVLALTAGVVALGPMVRRKQINTRWRPM